MGWIKLVIFTVKSSGCSTDLHIGIHFNKQRPLEIQHGPHTHTLTYIMLSFTTTQTQQAETKTGWQSELRIMQQSAD